MVLPFPGPPTRRRDDTETLRKLHALARTRPAMYTTLLRAIDRFAADLPRHAPIRKIERLLAHHEHIARSLKTTLDLLPRRRRKRA